MKYNINDNTGIAVWEHIINTYSMDNELSKPLPQITQTQYVQNASQYEETLTPKYIVKTIATVPTVVDAYAIIGGLPKETIGTPQLIESMEMVYYVVNM